MIRRPPRSTLFPTRRSSDLRGLAVLEEDHRRDREDLVLRGGLLVVVDVELDDGQVALLRDLLERSEEHTSELQSRQYLVCRLLLEKKKKHVYLSLSPPYHRE